MFPKHFIQQEKQSKYIVIEVLQKLLIYNIIQETINYLTNFIEISDLKMIISFPTKTTYQVVSYSNYVQYQRIVILVQFGRKIHPLSIQFFLYQYFYLKRMSLVPNIKYKTEYCLYWQEGKICEKGNYCFFAHGQQELRSIEENHKQIISRNSQVGLNEAKPLNYKTVFCKFYSEGQCKLGDKCTYAHQRREKRKKRASHQFKNESQTPLQFWPMSQPHQPYTHYYYQHFYQNYNSYPLFYPHLQGEMFEDKAKNPNEVGQISVEKVEDIQISSQTNKTFTYINRTESQKISQKFQSPENQSKLSPNTSKTESPAREPFLDGKKLQEQHDKQQI